MTEGLQRCFQRSPSFVIALVGPKIAMAEVDRSGLQDQVT